MWMEIRETGLMFLLIPEDLRNFCELHCYVLFLYKRKDYHSMRAQNTRVELTQEMTPCCGGDSDPESMTHVYYLRLIF